MIDATEWIGPYHDYIMGFHKVAKYYYYPGWHETGSALELFCNKKAFDELPADLQEIVQTTTLKHNLLILSEFEAKNNFYLNKILSESKVQLKQFPEDVLNQLKIYSKEVIQEIVDSDDFAKKVYESYSKFKKDITAWNEVSEKPVLKYL